MTRSGRKREPSSSGSGDWRSGNPGFVGQYQHIASDRLGRLSDLREIKATGSISAKFDAGLKYRPDRCKCGIPDLTVGGHEIGHRSISFNNVGRSVPRLAS